VREKIQKVGTLLLILLSPLTVNAKQLPGSSKQKECEAPLKKSSRARSSVKTLQKSEVVDSTPEAKPELDFATALESVFSKIKILTIANEMGFHAPTGLRAPSFDEAATILSVMAKFSKTDVEVVAQDFSDIQNAGFLKFEEAVNVLATSYASSVAPKVFATELSALQSNFWVPQATMDYKAQEVRHPDFKESLYLFNLVMVRGGKLKVLQNELIDMADALETNNVQLLIGLLQQADAMKVASKQLAAVVAKFQSNLAMEVPLIGFGSATEIINPTAQEAAAIFFLGLRLGLQAAELQKLIVTIQAETNAKDFATIIAGLSGRVEAKEEREAADAAASKPKERASIEALKLKNPTDSSTEEEVEETLSFAN
jgi:hypothetical protein